MADKKDKRALLRPGLNVECAVTVDEEKYEIDVRNATIYDQSDGGLILSQTSPKLLPSFAGRRIAVTFVQKFERMRSGLSGKVAGVEKEYKLSRAETAEAIILKRCSEVRPYNFRFAYRVAPPKEFRISICPVAGNEFTVENFSALGALVRYAPTVFYSPDQEIGIVLHCGPGCYKLQTRVLRVETGLSRTGKRYGQLALKFLDIDRALDDAIRKQIREIERKLAFQRIFE